MTTQIPEAVIRQLPPKRQLHGGFDIEYKLKYSGTAETDKRTMSFVDNLWGIEVTGAMQKKSINEKLLNFSSEKNIK